MPCQQIEDRRQPAGWRWLAILAAKPLTEPNPAFSCQFSLAEGYSCRNEAGSFNHRGNKAQRGNESLGLRKTYGFRGT
ncbi:MAG: hypothetical protein K1X71_14525 [Pirellulales bacterium]|nr:hypothetical protein [Pirellulales bacterium]